MSRGCRPAVALGNYAVEHSTQRDPVCCGGLCGGGPQPRCGAVGSNAFL